MLKQNIIYLTKLLNSLIEFVFIEKRLPQRLTENYIFQYPSFIKSYFNNKYKIIKYENIAVVDLNNVQKRYLFQILYFLSMSHTQLIFIWDFNIKNYIKLGYEGRRLLSIKNLKIVNKIPDNLKITTLVTENLQQHNYSVKPEKLRILVEQDVAQKPCSESFLIPYSVHPSFLQNYQQYTNKLSKFRSNHRLWSILFSGNVGFVGDKHLVERYYGVPSRDRSVEFLIKHTKQLNIKVIDNIWERKHLTKKAEKYSNYSLLLCQKKGLQEKWLIELSNANFFLALPGGYMLMCHNVIEAMSVGTIPIISYENWLYPNLIHGKNCLVYKTLDEMYDLIDQITKIDNDTIKTMKKNVINYYDEYLSYYKVVDFIKNYKGTNLYLYFNNENAEILKNVTNESILSCGGGLQNIANKNL
ncbi:hypothetical protein ACX27_18195 [Nostoc piscinale CENA21]|uniref:Exostosin GT47 domain-containing protein n=1 Tax=Nostoc piscinale CENA21 TaxID=224013 RepID=A0A0M4SYK5_9NOSO|nr:hypothetical protein [Nostoc piscinale]ALF54334.1 hypothetical protein ACX27_18195 [Nostoc piscinale CENA21]